MTPVLTAQCFDGYFASFLEATGISSYMDNESIAVIQPALRLQNKLEIESLPSITVIDLPPPLLLPVSSVSVINRVEGQKVPYTRGVGDGRFWEENSSDHQRTVAPPADGLFSVHKGDVPSYCSPGSTRGPQHNQGERIQP